MRPRYRCSLMSVAVLASVALGIGCQSAADGRSSPRQTMATASGTGGGAPLPGQGSTGVGGGGSNVGQPLPPPPVLGACEDPGRVTVRRLTGPQYDHTVRDLLGDSTSPGSGFPKDDAFLADALTVGPLLFEKYADAADRLVAEAWAREEGGTQPSGAKLWVCAPSEGDSNCAGQIVKSFARKAFRRPVTDVELAPFLGILGRPEGTLADRTRAALSSLLIAPNFVFRVELDPEPNSLVPHGLTSHELATRLSYLVWGSVPDAGLSAQADTGALYSNDVLRSELARMLADPKASVLTDEFAMRWLSLSEVGTLSKDTALFPEATPALFSAMQNESRLFLATFFEGTAPLATLFSADYTFANDLLARHYGLEATGLGAELQRVAVPAGPRRGILGHGSVLSLTSKPDHTSAVKRGKWVAARMLCAEPPPPPNGTIPEVPGAAAATSERERLAIHRANPVCAGCHTLIDPIGLGLENFDTIGRFRTQVDGVNIDAAGMLPGGRTFNGPAELSAVLSSDPLFHGCLSDQLSTFALGRALTSADSCLHTDMVNEVAKGATLEQLLGVLVTSAPFTARRGEPQGVMP
ncbi:MAG: DUF1592 domain-containing protein [Polyangiaceae bacterium]|nr:DUF1592 domain-containing protein [Polyangiaceae bacterium]